MHQCALLESKHGSSGSAQVRVPQTGGRVLVASDGVWDAFAKPERVARMSRAWHTEVLAPMRAEAGWLASSGCSSGRPASAVFLPRRQCLVPAHVGEPHR